MAQSAYLTLRGKNQGDIDGPVIIKGLENTIAVLSYTNAIASPRDPASGLATGPAQHSTILITKQVDQTTPPLWTAFVTNEALVLWQLNFWETNASGAPTQQIYTIKLTNASIASIREFTVASQDPTQVDLSLQQEITFSYQAIEWIWTDGGITAETNWQASA